MSCVLLFVSYVCHVLIKHAKFAGCVSDAPLHRKLCAQCVRSWQEFDVKAAHRRLTATCREQQHESFARQTSRRQQLIGRTMMPNGILGVGGAVNLRTSASRGQTLTSGHHNSASLSPAQTRDAHNHRALLAQLQYCLTTTCPEGKQVAGKLYSQLPATNTVCTTRSLSARRRGGHRGRQTVFWQI